MFANTGDIKLLRQKVVKLILLLSKYIEGIKTECYSKCKKSLCIWAKFPTSRYKFGALPGTCRAWDHPHWKKKPKRKGLKKKMKRAPLQGYTSPQWNPGYTVPNGV